MKFIKFLLITLIILAGLGYGVYYFGTNIASDKLMEVLTTELENSGEMENIKNAIESDPQLKAFLEDAASVDESTLPVKTKEEATRMIVKKVGVSGIKDIQSKVQQGEISKEELIREMEEKLTEEEITALKVIAYKELYNK
ncbi:hypothetical protein [Ornithinibacillus scapharcae]|uniref:hypothetical protein n=1 Tax=Ornithinibacillus scapharcae TaxID=1147159 RepID=UPI000225AE6E|nr:hypothetical protein [Ornithinibacillus scapharcae]